MCNEPARRQGMMEIRFGKGQRFTCVSIEPLAQGDLPALHMSGFPALLAHRLMSLGGKNSPIRLPEITVTVTATIGLWNSQPEATTRLINGIAK